MNKSQNDRQVPMLWRKIEQLKAEKKSMELDNQTLNLHAQSLQKELEELRAKASLSKPETYEEEWKPWLEAVKPKFLVTPETITRLVTAAIVLSTDGKNILLTKNVRDPKNHCWGFPAGIGAFRKTSDPAEAIVGEVYGDVGCLFTGDFFCFNHRQENGTPVITFFYVGKIIKGTPRPVCKYISEVGYFPIEEVRKMNLPYEQNMILEKYLASIAG